MYNCRRLSCSMSYSTQSNRTRHEKECTNGKIDLDESYPAKIIVCPKRWCAATFNRVFCLKRHLKRCFEPPMKCLVCNKECPGGIAMHLEETSHGCIRSSTDSLETIEDALPTASSPPYIVF